MTIFYAELYLTQDRYNPVIRATVPGSWVLRLSQNLPGMSDWAEPPEFYGNTIAEAKENCIRELKGQGLSGILRVNRV